MTYKETEQNRGLRYFYNLPRHVENTHIIFDPETNMKIAIKRESIVKFIQSHHVIEHNKNMRKVQ